MPEHNPTYKFDHLPKHEDIAGRMKALQGLLGPSSLYAIAESQTQGRGVEARRGRYLDLMWLIGHVIPKEK